MIRGIIQKIDYDIVIVGYGFVALYIANSISMSNKMSKLRVAIIKKPSPNKTEFFEKKLPIAENIKSKEEMERDWLDEINQMQSLGNSGDIFNASINDLRPNKLLSISYHTMSLLKDMISQDDMETYAEKIKHIRVTEQTSTTIIDLVPADINLPYFGIMISEKNLHSAMEKSFFQHRKNIDILEVESISSIRFSSEAEEIYNDLHGYDDKRDNRYDYARDSKHSFLPLDSDDIANEKIAFLRLQMSDGSSKTISTKLCIAADGRNSDARELSGIYTRKKSYNQIAIVCDIEHEFSHNSIAVEQFRVNGPFAILPQINKYRSSLVWIERVDMRSVVENISSSDLQQIVQEITNGYLGKIIHISKTEIYPLERMTASSVFLHNLVCVGDAAHTLHPVAGQGLNLAIREAQKLLDGIDLYWRLNMKINSRLMLDEYARAIKCDMASMVLFTGFINSLFSNDIAVVRVLRKLGMGMFNKFGASIKRKTMMLATGIFWS